MARRWMTSMLAAAVVRLTLAPACFSGEFENPACSYRFELPPAWSAREDRGPERVVVTSKKAPGVELRILSDRKSVALRPEDAERFRAKVQEALEKRCPKLDQPPALPNLLGRLGQYTYSFFCSSPGEDGARVSIVHLFAPRSTQPLFWYRIQLKVPGDFDEATKEVLSRVLATWKYLVPEPGGASDGARLDREAVLCEFRHCFAVQREIALALSMSWVSDGNLPEQLGEKVFAELKKRGHVRGIPLDPGQGAGTTGHYLVDGVSHLVACRVHGSADGTVPGRKECPAADGWEALRIANGVAGEFDLCAANRRSVAQAVSLYAMSKGTAPARLTPELVGDLVKGGYLKKAVQEPGRAGSGAADLYLYAGGKSVGCTVHGRADEAFAPKGR